jgi:hypothetical protein
MLVPIFSHKLPLIFFSPIHRTDKTIVIRRTSHLLLSVPVIGGSLTALYPFLIFKEKCDITSFKRFQ